MNEVYSILERENVYQILDDLQAQGVDTFIADSKRLPQLIILLLVLELGSLSLPRADIDSSQIQDFCKDMIGRFIGQPTVQAVQAMFLLALSLYRHDDLASTWPTLSLCVSMATTTGLNRQISNRTAARTLGEEERKRAWWAIFSFDKLLAFDSGRRSTIINDNTIGPELTTMPSVPTSRGSNDIAEDQDGQLYDLRQERYPFSDAVISLAKLLGEIGRRCIEVRDREESIGRDGLERVISKKVKITGEACLMLNRWAETLPQNIRPNSDLIYDKCTFPKAAFLSLYYYNA